MNDIIGFTNLVKTSKAFEIHLVHVTVIDIKIGDAQSSNAMIISANGKLPYFRIEANVITG